MLKGENRDKNLILTSPMVRSCSHWIGMGICAAVSSKKDYFSCGIPAISFSEQGTDIRKNHRWDEIPAAPSSALLHCSLPVLLLLFLIFPYSSQVKHRGSGWVMGQVDRAPLDVRGDKPDPMQFRGQVKTLLCTHRAAPGTSSDSSFSPTSSLICSNFLEPFMLPSWILIYNTHASRLTEVSWKKKTTQMILTYVTTKE